MFAVAVQPGHVAVPKLNRVLNESIQTQAHAWRTPADFKRMAAHSADTTVVGKVHGLEQTLFDMVLRISHRERSTTLHPISPPDPFKNISGDIPLGPGRVNLLA